MPVATRIALVLAWLGLTPAAAPAVGWRIVTPISEGRVALAFDPGSGRLAVGDARGLVIGTPGEALRRVPLRGPVRDVAFVAGAASWLLAATDAGLFRIDAGASLRAIALAPGHAAREVVRIATQSGAVALATAGGVFVSSEGTVWQRASRRWPSDAASAVALRASASGFDCWAIVAGRVWSVELHAVGGGFREADARQLVLPDAPTGNGPVDVAFDIGGADAVVLFADALAVRAERESEWRVLRPTLAPGARIQRLVAAHGVAWLATDRGLWSAPALTEIWTRAASPVGTRPVGDLVGHGEQLFAASDTAVREAHERSRAPLDQRPALPIPDGDPPIAALQRAALAYLDLESAHIRALRRGVEQRGWLPVVSLRVSGGGDRDRDVDFDEAFVSGEMRHLVDRSHTRSHDFDASLTLSWDLGDVAYHPEAVDVSREAREVLKLRDDVLDEVNQLYFERRALLAQLAMGGAALAPEEALRLRLRAAELAAGLDAWTGGWFDRVVPVRRP
ncbi:MAG: hypothetical protein JRH16_12430 [Deltaproteobacteria bacterium]|nr:hypothetical protein [Deltaproteobacteria bacterium]MBW2361382.1 hypothetical protein [Deltaproteobacteria bacterium]